MGFSNAPLLGRLVEVAVIIFAVVIAINQVGIAANLVNILFIGVVGALSLAFGLAFGLGGRDVAGRLTEQWYSQSQDAAGRIATASSSAGSSGGSMGGGSSAQRAGAPRPGMRSSVEPTARRQTPRSEFSAE
jgi:hypothetical protein